MTSCNNKLIFVQISHQFQKENTNMNSELATACYLLVIEFYKTGSCK